MASYLKKGGTKVTVPRENPTGAVPRVKGFQVVRQPRLKPLNTSNYQKAALQDPTQFSTIGFGQTGKTGES